jgi:2-octaprenyl-6-methoxyphenol hydroxylase
MSLPTTTTAADRPLRIAVIGAGPVGLSLALHAARALPDAYIALFDSRPVGVDPTRDPRTLAMSLGSIQLLQRLKAWDPAASQAITAVHVSQQAPALGSTRLPDPKVRIDAATEGVPQLGAVLSYGNIVAPLEAAWLAVSSREPERLNGRFGTAVVDLSKDVSLIGDTVKLTSRRSDEPEFDDRVESFDLAVVAEGGVFADQARKALTHDYRQTAWVGKVVLESAQPGVAYERFTHRGPAALLPLPPSGGQGSSGIGGARAALVWCVPSDDDPVRDLSDDERVAVLNTIFHRDTGRIVSVSPLKHFSLGLNAERTLVDGRIVRIGNAAQTLHPVAGQGLNLGMRDAFELVMQLAKAQARSAADSKSMSLSGTSPSNGAQAWVESALRRVEWSRAPDRWAMIAATDFLARSFTWRLPGLAMARGAALAGLQVATPLKSLIARQMMFGRR